MTFEEFETAARSAVSGIAPDAFVAVEKDLLEGKAWAVHVFTEGEPKAGGCDPRLSMAVEVSECESSSIGFIESQIRASLRRALEKRAKKAAAAS